MPPTSRDDADAQLRKLVREIRQELERRAVGAVDILEHEQLPVLQDPCDIEGMMRNFLVEPS